jgi:galactose mutarotase-like enzyme
MKTEGEMNGTVSHASWGSWPALELTDDSLAVTVVPAIGGRVVSLRDRRTDREWLTQSVPPDRDEAAMWAREDAVFSGRASSGWDECLPTVSGCADPLDPSGPPLRDHGDQWGRAADAVGDAGPDAIVCSWASPRWPYHLVRRLTLEPGAVVLAEYTLTSVGSSALPVLWSMHPTFQIEPGTRIDAGPASSMRLTVAMGWDLQPADALAWPVGPDGVDRSVALDVSAAVAAKLYTTGAAVASAVTPDGSTLELTWDPGLIPATGIWLSYGGWPVGGPPVHQVALEPTSSPDDHLAEAQVHGRAWSLAPGGTLSWWVRIASRVPTPATKGGA